MKRRNSTGRPTASGLKSDPTSQYELTTPAQASQAMRLVISADGAYLSLRSRGLFFFSVIFTINALTMTVTEKSNESPSIEASQPPFPEGGVQAWSVVAGSAIALACAFGYLSSFGYVPLPLRKPDRTNRCRVYENYYSTHQLSHKSPSDIAWIGSVQIFFQYATSVVSGGLFDLYGAKVSPHGVSTVRD
jgi:hypothetical protein